MRKCLAFATVAVVVAQPSRAECEDLDAPDPFAVAKETPQGPYYETEYFSLQLGGGFLTDYATYDRDDDLEDQMNLFPESGIRDLRGLGSGHIYKKWLNWTIGYMYDAGKNDWRFRQTGLIIHFANGSLFLGRTKEGFSTNKMTVGYYGWMNERAAANDAFLPILNDGVRWTQNVLGGHLTYNVGAYTDVVGDVESYNKNDWVFAGRLVWLPLSPDSGRTLHLAAEVRYAGANDGVLLYRSKPESFFAQSQAVDTGMFEADRSTIVGAEAYYLEGPWAFGGEYFVNLVNADAVGDPYFHGGEMFASYMITGESHPYIAKTSVFGNVKPKRSFFDGGWGAWEVAARLSYVDLDDDGVAGGKFTRITPIVNWYLNPMLRFEAAYGYGVLDRQGMEGGIHFFQTRVQISIK